MNKPRLATFLQSSLSAWLLTFALTGAGVSASAEDTPPFKITTKRDDDRVTVKVDKGRTIFDIRSPFGISNATFERTAGEWPKTVVLRLHLKGLEHYQVTSGELVIAGSAPTRGKPNRSADKTDGAANDERPLEATVRMFDENGKPTSEIPLQNGYFEIELPPKLLVKNPKSLRVEWIDFYRN